MVFPAAMADMEDMPSSRAPAIKVKMLRFIRKVLLITRPSAGRSHYFPVVLELAKAGRWTIIDLF